MQKILFVLFNFLIVITLGLASFLVGSFGFSLVFVKLVLGGQPAEGDTLAVTFWAFLVGLLAAVISLIPSYKICMKMAERLRFRGWPLTHPRRLFVLSLFLLILPIILLMLSGVVFGAN